jgi:hypothetical protein
MLAFRGRSKDTTKLKGKPIKEGYKNWVLADHGYVWGWLWHSVKVGTENSKAPLDKRIPAVLPDTQRMILRLALLLNTNIDYTLYLDNLFMSIPLTKALQKASIGVCGTTRKSSKGLPRWLDDLKRENRELIWDSAVGVIEDGVLCFVWQDNTAVLGKNAPLEAS